MQEVARRDARDLGPDAGIVVLNLVVVPDGQAGGGGVQALQVGVGAMQGVAVAIARQGRRLFQIIGAHHLIGAIRS